MDESTVFDNNSIWILEQITQPLYTVTNERQGRHAVAGDRLHRVDGPADLHLQPAAGREVLRRHAHDVRGREVLACSRRWPPRQGWGYIDSAIKSVEAPSPSTVVINLKYTWAPLLADLSLFANGIVPDNYGGKTAAAVLRRADRHRPVQVGLLAQGPARSSW